jgi:hypothetical protein
MELPFSTTEFLDLFARYNQAFWPAAVVLWIATAVTVALLPTSWRRSDRVLAGLLAAHWMWSGAVYHWALFTSINPAAWLFGALFIAQGALFLLAGSSGTRLSFATKRTGWGFVAWPLMLYALAYPGINAIAHDSLMRIPTFGVPCTTTVFTAGLLLLAERKPWALVIIPVVWSVVGGSAAWLLGMGADAVLPIGGIAMVMHSLQRRATTRSVPVQADTATSGVTTR